MTIIAYDGRFVAADSQEVYGHNRQLKQSKKIITSPGKCFAFSGSVPLFIPMIDWYVAGAKPDEIPKVGDEDHSTLFVFTLGKSKFYKTDLPYPEEILSPLAWGVGADYAIAALDCGKTAEEAVEIALARSIWLGGPVQVVDLEELD